MLPYLLIGSILVNGPEIKPVLSIPERLGVIELSRVAVFTHGLKTLCAV